MPNIFVMKLSYIYCLRPITLQHSDWKRSEDNVLTELTWTGIFVRHSLNQWCAVRDVMTKHVFSQ